MLVPVLPLLVLLLAPDPNVAAAEAMQSAGNLQAARHAYELVLKASRAAGLSGLAQVDLALGRYADSIAEAAEAGTLFAMQRNPREQAQMLTTSGIARFYSGDFNGALHDFEQGLGLARGMGDHEAQVTRLNNIGNVYYAQGRYGEALREYETAQAQNSLVSVARRQLTSANMAGLYQRMGQYSRALKLYQEMTRQTDLPARERAQMLSNMGTLYRRLGDPVTALETYAQAQLLYRKQAAFAGEIGVLNNIGIAQTSDLSQPENAVVTFTRALGLAETSGGKQLVMNCLLYRGEAFLRLQRLPEAEGDFTRARGIATELRADEERWKAAYGVARVEDRRHKLDSSDKLLREALGVIESMRRAAASNSGRAGFLIERRDVYDLLIRHASSTQAVFQLMEQSRARDLQDRLHVSPVTLDEFRRRLPVNTLLLEYWTSEDSMATLWATRDGAGLVRHAVFNPDDLMHALSDPQPTEWLPLATTAGNALFAGVSALHDPALKNVLVIPDGDLSRIPFESLPLDRKTLLIDRATVSYLPLASVFGSNAGSLRVVFPWNPMLIAFGDPSRTAALPAALQEISKVASAVGGRSTIHVGPDAQKRYIDKSATVLHLATHAFADSEDPDRSYILFAPPDRPNGSDYLYLKEVTSLPAHFDLVTISACDSGTGKFARGEGAQSFASAFMAAGSRAVVTSLWRVGDRPTAELMGRFYASMARGNNAAEALREAKLAFRRSGTSASHPAYWAAFVLAGDITMPISIAWWMLTAGLLFLCGLMLAVFRRQEGKASPYLHPHPHSSPKSEWRKCRPD